jgi:hypothetical protein
MKDNFAEIWLGWTVEFFIFGSFQGRTEFERRVAKSKYVILPVSMLLARRCHRLGAGKVAQLCSATLIGATSIKSPLHAALHRNRQKEDRPTLTFIARTNLGAKPSSLPFLLPPTPASSHETRKWGNPNAATCSSYPSSHPPRTAPSRHVSSPSRPRSSERVMIARLNVEMPAEEVSYAHRSLSLYFGSLGPRLMGHL